MSENGNESKSTFGGLLLSAARSISSASLFFVLGMQYFWRVILPLVSGVIRPVLTAAIVAWSSRELFFNLYNLFGINIALEVDCTNNTMPGSSADCTLALQNWGASEFISTVIFPAACLTAMLPSRLHAILKDYQKQKLEAFKKEIKYQEVISDPKYTWFDSAAYWATAMTCMLGAATGTVSTILNKLSNTQHDTNTNIFEVFPLYISFTVAGIAMLLAYFPFASFVGGVYRDNIAIRETLENNDNLKPLLNELTYKGMKKNIMNPARWDINAAFSAEAQYLYPAMHSIDALFSLAVPEPYANITSTVLSVLAIVIGHRISVYGRVSLQQCERNPQLKILVDGIKQLHAMDRIIAEVLYENSEKNDFNQEKEKLQRSMQTTKNNFFSHVASNQNSPFDFNDTFKTFADNNLDNGLKNQISEKLSAQTHSANQQNRLDYFSPKAAVLALPLLLLAVDCIQYLFNNTQAIMSVLLLLQFERIEQESHETYQGLLRYGIFTVSAASAMASLPYFYRYSLKPAWNGLNTVFRRLSSKSCCGDKKSGETEPLLVFTHSPFSRPEYHHPINNNSIASQV